MQKSITLTAGIFMVAALTLAVGVSVASAHHNSPMYEEIEENENFDSMDNHEEAVDDLTDNSNMDNATELGTYTDTASQAGM